MKRFAIVALSLAAALTGSPSAMAFPASSPPRFEAPHVQLVEYRRYGGYGGGYYHGHHHGGGDDWAWALGGLAAGAVIGGLLAQPNYYGPGYYEPDYYYGPTYYRPRYYAPRAYRQVYYGGSAHTRWCYARYRSYRAYDDTFQPYYGPRQPCVSPYY